MIGNKRFAFFLFTPKKHMLCIFVKNPLTGTTYVSWNIEYHLIISDYLSYLLMNRSIQINVITGFVVILNVGIKRGVPKLLGRNTRARYFLL